MFRIRADLDTKFKCPLGSNKPIGASPRRYYEDGITCGEGQTEGAMWSATLQQGLIQR